MPVPEGYMTTLGVYAYIRDKLGYGRRSVENKLGELERAGIIQFVAHPGHRGAKLLSVADVEKLVAALTLTTGKN